MSQDILKPLYLLKQVIKLSKVWNLQTEGDLYSRTAMINAVGMNTVKRLIAQVQGRFAHVDRNCASCFGHPKYDKINLF